MDTLKFLERSRAIRLWDITTPGRLCSIMAAMTGIRDLKKRSSELFRKCWAEAAFISLLQMGLFLLFYAGIMLLGIITGALQT